MPKKISIEDLKKELEEAGIQEDTSLFDTNSHIYLIKKLDTGPVHMVFTMKQSQNSLVRIKEEVQPTETTTEEIDEIDKLYNGMKDKSAAYNLTIKSFSDRFYCINFIVTKKHTRSTFIPTWPFITVAMQDKQLSKLYLSHINTSTSTWTYQNPFSAEVGRDTFGFKFLDSVPDTIELSRGKVTTVQNDASSFPRLSELLKNEPDTAMRKMYIPDEDREKILTSLNDSRSSTSTEVPKAQEEPETQKPETQEPETKEPETTEVEVPEPEDASGTEVQIMELTIDQKVVPMYLRKDNMLLDYITKTIVGRVSTNTNLAKKGTVSVDWVQGFPENLSVYTKYKDQSYFHTQ